MARVLDLPEDNVRVVAGAIGGGSGVKVAGRYAVLCALLARQTGRPVKMNGYKLDLSKVLVRRALMAVAA